MVTSDQCVAPTEQLLMIRRSAVISPCGKYRYRLWRKWAESERMPVLWIMLNPSTADATVDDPTIKRCMAFSNAWGYGSMWVGNLYAYRSPDPAVLWGMGAAEARGPDNDKHLSAMSHESAIVVCAWGAPGGHYRSTRLPLTILSPGGVWCIGETKNGSPKHPLARGKHRVPDGAPLRKVA